MRLRVSTFAGLWASVVLVLIITAALVLSLQKSHQDNALVHHTRDVQFALGETLDDLQDAEAGQRGYIITGNESYLAPCTSAVQNLKQSIGNLRALTSDNLTQRRNLDRLEPLIKTRMDIMQTNIRLRRTQGLAAAAASVASGRGKAAMERVHSVLADMQSEETRLLAKRETAASAQQTALFTTLLLGSTGLFLLVALSTVAVQREMRRRYEAQERQREIAERLSVTLSSIGDAVIATDAKGKITFLNGVAAQATGWTQQQAENQPCANVFRIVNETTRLTVDSPVDRVIREGKIVGLANHTVLLAKDGREISIDDSAAPIRDSHGDLLGVILVFRDISARRLTDLELEERARLAALAAEIGAAMIAVETLPIMLGRCAEALVERLDAALACIWLVNVQTEELELQASKGLDIRQDGPQSRMPVGTYLAGQIAQERQPYLSNSIAGDPAIIEQQWAEKEGLSAAAGYPLIVSGRLVGVMAIFARNAFSENAQQAMASIADQVALGIERKRDEESLRHSEERLRAALVASETGTFRWNLVTNAMDWDGSLDRLYGLLPGQTARNLENFLRMVHADDRQYVAECCAQCRDVGADFDTEFRVVWPDGTLHWMDGKGKTTPVENDGPLYLTGACMDVTSRKRVQAEMEDLNTRLKRAMAESHHRIKNNLQMLAALVDMQRLNNSETVPISELVRLGQHIRTLASLHDLLTAEAKFGGDTDTVSLPGALAKLISMLQQTVPGRPITLTAADIHLPLNKCGPFVLLANELISNAIKHGEGAIGITLALVPKGNGQAHARLEVCDDGSGFPPGFNAVQSANTGIELVESMGRWDLAGEVAYQNGPEGGARVHITFPVPKSGR